MTSPSTEVLVVGAGPTGLMAAAQLAERGVVVRLVDAAAERSDKSRAIVVQARTLELLDKMGLARAMCERGHRALGMDLHVEGERVGGFDVGALQIDGTPFPFMLFLSQVETERVLEQRVRELGVEIERPVSLRELRQDDDGVTATVDRDGQPETIRARFVVGADGAHSVVRKSLGLRFDGAAYRSDFILGDVELRGDLPRDRGHVFLAKRGVLVFFPMSDRTTRVMTMGQPHVDDAPPLQLSELQAQVASHTDRDDLELRAPTWLARFHLHHRGVDRYRVGRAFVAGDAAHIHSPAGGQGMNTGIQDAYNLAWKLAAVLRGRAPEALLDSYHAERHPVGMRLLEFTDRAFGVASSTNPLLTTVRNFLAPHVVPRLIGGRQQRVFSFASQIGIRYRKSPAVAEHLEGADAAFRAGPRAGDRAPEVGGEQGVLLRRMTGTGWWLLGLCGHDEGTPKAPAVDLRLFPARLRAAIVGRPEVELLMIAPTLPPEADPERWLPDPEHALHRAYGLHGPGVYLVRPDGHIAFRSPGAGIDPLCRWLDANLHPAPMEPRPS